MIYYTAEFLVQNVDGKTLLGLNEVALSEFGITNAIIRKRFLRHLEFLKKRNLSFLKSRSLEELDEYVLFLETHRIKVCYSSPNRELSSILNLHIYVQVGCKT